MPYLQDEEDGRVRLDVYVQPRASKTAFAGVHGGALKLRITAPPVEGRANEAVIAFLSKTLRIPKAAVTLKSGHNGRHKQFILSGISGAGVRKILAGVL